MTFDIQVRINELVVMGVPGDIAAKIAANDMLAFQQTLNEIQNEERAKALASAGVQDFLGYKITGMKPGDSMPYRKGCKALENGVAVQPASLGKDSKTGADVLYPPKLWVFVKDHKPSYVGQLDCSGLLKAFRALGAEQVMQVLESIGSETAIAAYASEKEQAAKDGKITARQPVKS
jgi:hypothetical protein